MTQISFEFFPPKTDDQRETLEKAVGRLKTVAPDYVSMTFGAGGSTLTHTVEAVRSLRTTHGLDAAPHLSCMGGSRAEIRALLDDYLAWASTASSPCAETCPPAWPASVIFATPATGSVHPRRNRQPFPYRGRLLSGSSSQANDALADIENFRRKIESGANGAITQYFYNADGYFRFVDAVRAVGIDVPIVPGIMPISNFSQLRRFSDMCGAEIPRWLGKRLAAFGDDAGAIREFSSDVVGDLCRKLIAGGAPGLHFYTLNRAKPTLAILERL